MNTRELRVGNWVMSYDNPNEEPEYSEVISVGRGWASLSESNSYKTDEDWIDPIELTHDLITSIGFVYEFLNLPTEPIDCKLCRFGIFSLYFNHDGNEYSYKVGSCFMPVKYLHQLQNLYFAVTGEELDVKL